MAEEHAARLRTRAEQALHEHLDQFTRHLNCRDVAEYRFDKGQSAGVDAYITGGASGGRRPHGRLRRVDPAGARDANVPINNACAVFCLAAP